MPPRAGEALLAEDALVLADGACLAIISTTGSLPLKTRVHDAITRVGAEREEAIRDFFGIRVLVVPGVVDEVRSASEDAAIRVVAVVEEASRRSTTELLAAGASGVVLAAELESALPAAIRAIVAGLVVIPDTVRRAVQRPMLSAREKQILGLIVMGMPNAEIAQRLFLAESTVKSHLTTIFQKLGVRSRKEAADLVLDPSAGLGTGILSLTGGDPAAGPD